MLGISLIDAHQMGIVSEESVIAKWFQYEQGETATEQATRWLDSSLNAPDVMEV